MFRYYEMKNIAEERHAEFGRLVRSRGRDQQAAGESPAASSRKTKKYSIAWIVNLLTLGFLS